MIVLGVGFSSACSAEELGELAAEVLRMAAAARDVSEGGCIATLERKRGGGQLEEVGRRLDLVPRYLATDELAAVQGDVATSARVTAAVGTGSVAEAAALAAAGPGARLVVEKTASGLATCAAVEVPDSGQTRAG